MSYERLGPCLSGRVSSVPRLYEKEGPNFCFWHFILESVLRVEEKNSNVESRQRRWGWNLEAILRVRAEAAGGSGIALPCVITYEKMHTLPLHGGEGMLAVWWAVGTAT